MKKYLDLIDQTFDFPTRELRIENDELYFNDIPLMEVIRQFGTPLKLTYLPKISEKIQAAKKMFQDAIKKYNYQGNYIYCYCTKSSHFRFVVEEALKNDIHLETSSAYDIHIIRRLYKMGLIDKSKMIICNGFKRKEYQQGICDLINDGFVHCTPVLDNLGELDYYLEHIHETFNIGIRVAADEEPNFDFYTSRLGIRYGDITEFYKSKIHENPKVKLKMLHFFINSGIRDSAYYWSELSKFIYKYCDLRKICHDLDTIDIGGGFPIKTSLTKEFDHQYMAEQIIENVQWICQKKFVTTPNIMTEFGSYTVGESGAVLYSIMDQKLQNDKELWYMIDGSFITHMPDTWAKNQKFIMLAVNHWDKEYQQVHLGGLTCDSDDYYNSEEHSTNVFLPILEDLPEPLYVGFFHTGAYQENLAGYGGIQHCLIPATRHVIISRDEDGEFKMELFQDEQSSDTMLKVLGY